MVGWHHQLNGHEFEQTPGDTEGQGSLVCCGPWGCKESDKTQQPNSNNKNMNKGHVTVKRVSTQIENNQMEFLEIKNIIHGNKTQWIKK